MGWSGLFHEEPWRRSIAMAGLGGAISLALLLFRGVLRIPDTVAETLFIMVHPIHVFVAAATMVRLLTRNGRFRSLPAVATACRVIPSCSELACGGYARLASLSLARVTF